MDAYGVLVGPAEREQHFESLVTALVDPLRRFLARRTDPDTAEDVLADTLLVVWRRLDDVPPEPLPWAYGVARNSLANANRARRRQARVAGKVATLDPPRDSAPEPAGQDPDLVAAFGRLAERDREVLRLWAWEDLGPTAIGEALGLTANAAGVRLHRAKAALRVELGKDQRASGHEQGEGR